VCCLIHSTQNFLLVLSNLLGYRDAYTGVVDAQSDPSSARCRQNRNRVRIISPGVIMRTLFAATFAAAFVLSSLAITAATPARPAKRGR
jgi:hypothetical protein